MKQVIIIVLAIVAIIGGAVVFGKEDTAAGTPSAHIFGNTESTVKLIEFGDFECPACAYFYPIVEQVKENYKNDISFQFMHFPLVQSHQNALAAHRAAEAAGKQGKFWDMYNLLYSNQENWNGPSQTDPIGVDIEQAISIFESYAKQIELNFEQYQADVANGDTLATINADIAVGKSEHQATGTPTFILNGQKIEDTSTIDTVEEFSAVIDKALGRDTTDTAESIDPTQQEVSTEPEEVPTGE